MYVTEEKFHRFIERRINAMVKPQKLEGRKNFDEWKGEAKAWLSMKGHWDCFSGDETDTKKNFWQPKRSTIHSHRRSTYTQKEQRMPKQHGKLYLLRSKTKASAGESIYCVNWSVCSKPTVSQWRIMYTKWYCYQPKSRKPVLKLAMKWWQHSCLPVYQATTDQW